MFGSGEGKQNLQGKDFDTTPGLDVSSTSKTETKART